MITHARWLWLDRLRRNAGPAAALAELLTPDPSAAFPAEILGAAAAWALDAWQDGATGIVPWQTVNKSGSALKEADQLGLFIFDKNAAGETVIRHSLRLKAYREAQQLIEYLNLLQQRRGWSQDQMQRFVNQYVDLNAHVTKTNEADAGTTAYGRLSASGLETLRTATARLLEAK